MPTRWASATHLRCAAALLYTLHRTASPYTLLYTAHTAHLLTLLNTQLTLCSMMGSALGALYTLEEDWWKQTVMVLCLVRCKELLHTG